MNDKTPSLLGLSDDNEFVHALAQLISGSSKTLNEVAIEAGYANEGMLTMVLTGRSRLPLNKVVLLSRVLGTEPAAMLTLWFKSYMPAMLAIVNEHLLPASQTDREREWLAGLRRDFGTELPPYDRSLFRPGDADRTASKSP